MKKYYHITSLDKIRSISNTGLSPDNEENNKLVNETENKLSFAEGMTGVIAQYANYQKHYDLIKSGVTGGITEQVIEKVNTTKNMQEYLGEGVYVSFSGENIENENDFMNGTTEKSVDSDNINVCILKNNETGEVTYLSSNIVHYMMSKVPVETINYTGANIAEDAVEKRTEIIRSDISTYIKSHEQEINTYKSGEYTIENIPIKSFCMQYLFQKGDSVSGQSLGKATMDLLKDIEAVREMEAQLDKAVRELVLSREEASEDYTVIPKERNERQKNTN